MSDHPDPVAAALKSADDRQWFAADHPIVTLADEVRRLTASEAKWIERCQLIDADGDEAWDRAHKAEAALAALRVMVVSRLVPLYAGAAIVGNVGNPACEAVVDEVVKCVTALRQRHAEAVESAYREGFISGEANDVVVRRLLPHEKEQDAWRASEAKKGLER